jgi:hypothetical protein
MAVKYVGKRNVSRDEHSCVASAVIQVLRGH